MHPSSYLHLKPDHDGRWSRFAVPLLYDRKHVLHLCMILSFSFDLYRLRGAFLNQYSQDVCPYQYRNLSDDLVASWEQNRLHFQ